MHESTTLTPAGNDGRSILFATLNGEVHMYDAEGIYLMKVPVYCLDEGTEGSIPAAGIDWYHAVDRSVPSLATAFENGRVQILRSESDDRPVLIDTQLQKCVGIRWNPSGTTL